MKYVLKNRDDRYYVLGIGQGGPMSKTTELRDAMKFAGIAGAAERAERLAMYAPYREFFYPVPVIELAGEDTWARLDEAMYGYKPSVHSPTIIPFQRTSQGLYKRILGTTTWQEAVL